MYRTDGSVTVVDGARPSDSAELVHKDISEAAVSAAWDPLSPDYLLVVYQSGQMILWDAAQKIVSERYDPPSGGVAGVGWVAPGMFVTADARTGALRIWNVSKKCGSLLLIPRMPSLIEWCRAVCPRKRFAPVGWARTIWQRWATTVSLWPRATAARGCTI